MTKDRRSAAMEIKSICELEYQQINEQYTFKLSSYTIKQIHAKNLKTYYRQKQQN